MAVIITGNNTPTAGGVTYGDGSTYVNTTAGTTGQALISAGASAPAFGTLGIAGGGTNSTATATAGGVGYGTGTAHAYTTAGSAGGVLYSAGASAPAFSAVGTSGQILTSAGASAPTWSTLNTGPFGTDLSYVDYLLTTSSALSSSVSQSIRMQVVSLDGTSELMIIQSNASAHAVVFNTSTNTFGTPILVRTANLIGTATIGLAKISSTAVLVCSLADTTTALETVVLTISGSTITVGTALATTLAATSNLIDANTRLVVVGSSYILNYYTTADSLPKFRAITVSGSTPSIGAELAYAGGTTFHHSYAQSATILLHFSMTASTTVFVLPITVSGTTLTAGTAATVSTTGSTFVTGALSDSRYALAYVNTTGRGAVVSVAGSVASISTAATTMAISTWFPMMQVFGNQAFIATGSVAANSINVLTDTAGVATLGTDIAIPTAGVFVGYLSTSKVFFASNTAGNSAYYQYGISSGSPVLEKTFPNVTSTSVITTGLMSTASYTRPLSGLPQSGSGTSGISLRTSAGKLVLANTQLPFVTSIEGTYPAELQQAANSFASFNDGISEAIVWGFPTSLAASTTTVQLRKVTLA